MPAPAPYEIAVLDWQPELGGHTLPDVVPLNYVCGELACKSRAEVLLILGLGETYTSAASSVSLVEHELKKSAAAAWPSYAAMGEATCPATLDLISDQAPFELAKKVGHEEPVDLVTNSLGCLAVSSAAKYPEMFRGVGVMAPFAFGNEQRGRLPLVGWSHRHLRALSLGWRLGVETPIQMWHQALIDPHFRAVGKNAIAEIEALEAHWRTAVDHALSPATGQRAAESFMSLAKDPDAHPAAIAIGDHDKLVRRREVAPTLARAAVANGVSLADARKLVHMVPGGHASWCSPEGLGQLMHGGWLASLLGTVQSDSRTAA